MFALFFIINDARLYVSIRSCNSKHCNIDESHNIIQPLELVMYLFWIGSRSAQYKVFFQLDQESNTDVGADF